MLLAAIQNTKFSTNRSEQALFGLARVLPPNFDSCNNYNNYGMYTLCRRISQLNADIIIMVHLYSTTITIADFTMADLVWLSGC